MNASPSDYRCAQNELASCFACLRAAPNDAHEDGQALPGGLVDYSQAFAPLAIGATVKYEAIDPAWLVARSRQRPWARYGHAPARLPAVVR